MSASPGQMRTLVGRARASSTSRALLPELRVPTLVLHRAGDQLDRRAPLALHGRADPGREATSSCPGDDNLPFVGDTEAIVGEIEEFLTGGRAAAQPDRALLTVLFTDIVDGTGARRRSSATAAGATCSPRTTPRSAAQLDALRRPRGQDDRRRLPRGVRRPAEPGGALRARDRRRRRRPRRRRPRRAAHGRVRAHRRRHRRHGRPHRRARERARGRAARCMASGTTFGTVVGSGLEWDVQECRTQGRSGHAGRSSGCAEVSNAGMSTKAKWLLSTAVALAILVPTIAIAAGEGNPLRGGVRNPSSNETIALTRETEIIANTSTYGTRQSNKSANGGGAVYGCRSADGGSAAGNEPCVRAVNLSNGRAFEFQSTPTEAGRIDVGGGGDTVRPFTHERDRRRDGPERRPRRRLRLGAARRRASRAWRPTATLLGGRGARRGRRTGEGDLPDRLGRPGDHRLRVLRRRRPTTTTTTAPSPSRSSTRRHACACRTRNGGGADGTGPTDIGQAVTPLC